MRLRIFIPCWLVKWVYEQLAKHLNSNCTITIYVDLVLPGIGNQRHDKEYENIKWTHVIYELVIYYRLGSYIINIKERMFLSSAIKFW